MYNCYFNFFLTPNLAILAELHPDKIEPCRQDLMRENKNPTGTWDFQTSHPFSRDIVKFPQNLTAWRGTKSQADVLTRPHRILAWDNSASGCGQIGALDHREGLHVHLGALTSAGLGQDHRVDP